MTTSSSTGPAASTTGASTPTTATRKALSVEDALLPPNQWLTHQAFEDFTELLLNASKFTDPGITHVTSVARWGEPGEKQNGIDFAGTLSDRRTASWQCKKYKKFTPAHAAKAVQDNTYDAQVHHLVLSCKASRPVREEIAKHPQWVLIDQRGLKQKLDDLHRHKRRDVLEETFGPTVRRQLMDSPGQDAVISLEAFAKDRRDPTTILNDRGAFSGRQRELASLLSALHPEGKCPRVVLVTGPGGRGKTRLLLEGLQQAEARHPQRPIVLLAPGAELTQQTVQELPATAGVIVVDDVHRDPDALLRLMTYLRETPGAQAVLGCRPSGYKQVEAVLAERFGPDDRPRMEVDRLALGEAREMVADLADGLGLDWSLREHLASQAVDSPHVAVITLNLIRRKELTRALAIDSGLRESVLSRYLDVAVGMVNGVSSEEVNTLLAVHSVLRGVRDGDEHADAHIREITGLTQRRLLRTREALRDRGVLVEGDGGTTVVVPELLGDKVLEDEAAADGQDTGFTSDIWERFGPAEGPRLLNSLAELDWRLKERHGGPDVLTAVWGDLRDHLLNDDLEGVRDYLDSLDRLPLTHPARFTDLLDELRGRLVDLAAGSPDGGRGGQRPPSAARQRRRAFGLGATEPADVLQLMAPLYGRCAAREPALLEQALEALWALRRLPLQLSDTRSEHPERVVADMLADLGHLPDLSFPERTVGAVQRMLDREESFLEPSAAVSPMFMLRPLLAKQTTFTEQSDQRTLQMYGRFVSASWAGPLRERIRVVLLQQAAGTDLRRAGEAVLLLHEMLLPLHPTHRGTITADQDAAWEADEVASVVTLARAAEQTSSSAVRRHIRQQVCWSSEHARSLLARHQALDLVTALDQRTEDDLTEALMPLTHSGTVHRRGMSAPSLEELTADRAAEKLRREQLSQDERAAEDEAHIDSAYERHQAVVGAALARAVDVLTQLDDAGLIIAALDAAARDVTAVVSTDRGQAQVRVLFAGLAEAVPDRVPGLIEAVVAGAVGPLDADVDHLVERWRRRDPEAVLRWLELAATMRTGLRVAIAQGFQRHDWLVATPAFGRAFDAGLADEDQNVRQTYLLSVFSRYPSEPARAVQVLLDADAPAQVCEEALHCVAITKPQPWGAALEEQDAEAVLRLVDRAGWDDWTLQKITGGVATSHPVLVLNHLVRRGTVVGHRVERSSLPAALEANAEQTSTWMLQRCAGLTESDRHHVATAAFPEGLGPDVATALRAGLHQLDAAGLLAIADCLHSVSTWPAARPDLARMMLDRARQLGTATLGELLPYLSIALRVDCYSSEDGVCEELQTAHDLCARTLETEVDVELRQLLSRAQSRYSSDMARLMHEDEDR